MEAEKDVYEDDDGHLDKLPKETEPSAPKHQKLSQNLLNQISQQASSYMVPPNTDQNSLSLSVPHQIPLKTSTGDTGSSHPCFHYEVNERVTRTDPPRKPRAPKNMSVANATPLGSGSSLPLLPHTLRKTSEAKPTLTGAGYPPIHVLDMEGACDALSMRPLSQAPKN